MVCDLSKGTCNPDRKLGAGSPHDDSYDLPSEILGPFAGHATCNRSLRSGRVRSGRVTGPFRRSRCFSLLYARWDRVAVTILVTMDTMHDSDPGGDVPLERRIDWQTALARHDRWLRTVVYARVREPQAVDDVMQEVALAAVRQSAPIQDPAKIEPWLYRLAVRQSLLYRRRCGRQRRLTEQYAVDAVVQETGQRESSPLDWLLRAERLRMVRRAVGRLATRDAEILMLKYRENWTYHQIAHHLGVSHSAVEARLHRARKRLRAELVALDAVEIV